MSDFANIIGAGIDVLRSVTGQSLEYRAGKAGTWTSLTRGILTYDDPVVIAYDDERGEVIGPATGQLKVPIGATKLVPATPDQGGYYVREGGVTVWAVVGMQEVNYAHVIYTVRRADIIQSRPEQQGTV